MKRDNEALRLIWFFVAFFAIALVAGLCVSYALKASRAVVISDSTHAMLGR